MLMYNKRERKGAPFIYTVKHVNMYRDWVCWVEVKGKAVDGREKRPVGLAMSESRGEVQKIRSAPPVCVCVRACVCVCVCVCVCICVCLCVCV